MGLVVIAAAALFAAGAAVGRLRMALVPFAIGVVLAVLAIVAPSEDAGELGDLIPFLYAFAGIAASGCVALGALLRRAGRTAG
jgi:hypothetical protein